MVDEPRRTQSSPGEGPVLQALCDALDGLRVACCVVDTQGVLVAWNQTLTGMCPAQAPQLRPGALSLSVLECLRSEMHSRVQNAWVELPGLGAIHLWYPSSICGARAPLSAVRPVIRACLELLDLGAEGEAVLHQQDEEWIRRLSLLPGRRLQDLVAEHSSDVVALVRHGTMTYVSPAVRRMLGWDPAQLEGAPLADLVHGEDQANVQQQLAAIPSSRIELQARMRCADGTFRWTEATVAPLREAPDGTPELVLNIRDVSARKAMELTLAETLRALEELAHTDGLTGIPNRRSFEEDLDTEWRRCRREGRPLALLLLDVDRFKQINDSDGHQAGDRVLQRVAQCLQHRALRPGDRCARFGGDEFAMVMPNTTVEQALQMAERVRADVAESRGAADEPAPPATVSIGVAALQVSAASPAALIACADEALYRAKMLGRDTVLAWTADMAASAGPAHHPSPIDRARQTLAAGPRVR